MISAKSAVVAALTIWSSAATLGSSQQARQAPIDPWREFPSYEQTLAAIVQRGANAKRAERERHDAPAAAATIGYSGATVVMEKVDSRWTAVRLVDQWIT